MAVQSTNQIEGSGRPPASGGLGRVGNQIAFVGVFVALLSVFAAAFFGVYLELASLNREIGAMGQRDVSIERRLTRLEEGQAAIRTDLDELESRIFRRLDALDVAIRDRPPRGSD